MALNIHGFINLSLSTTRVVQIKFVLEKALLFLDNTFYCIYYIVCQFLEAGLDAINGIIDSTTNTAVFFLLQTRFLRQMSKAGTVYFIPSKRTFVIVLTNTSGPLDASESSPQNA